MKKLLASFAALALLGAAVPALADHHMKKEEKAEKKEEKKEEKKAEKKAEEKTEKKAEEKK